MLIKAVSAKAVRDSRGEKTIEVSVNGACASSPSGKSTGMYETKMYYKSLDFCIDFLNNFSDLLELHSFDDLIKLERVIEKKLQLKRAREFGGNALFAFESAVLKALAAEQGKELWQVINSKAKKFPRPVGNAIGGGLHSGQFKIRPIFQEFLLVPREKSFEKNVSVMQKIYSELARQLRTKKVNDEGALHAACDNEQVLSLLSSFSDSIDIGVDCAASSFYQHELYNYGKIKRTRPAHIQHVLDLIKSYEVFYVEDPIEQEDFEGFAQLRKQDREAMVVGDDLTATHFDRVEKAIENRSISATIIKPNQNGSLVEVRGIIELCKKHNIRTVMSHRSGETMDDALADYAFGFQTDFIKCGIATAWRECKLKRMIEIERNL